MANRGSFLQKAEDAKDDLENVRVELIGKKSELAALKKEVGRIRQEHRGIAGQAVNHLDIFIGDPLRDAETHLQLFN